MHKLGVYWAPQHDPTPVLEYIHRLQPPVVRVMTEDVNHICQVHAAAPGAMILPRVWRIDDDNGRAVREMNENATEAGKRHAEQLDAQIYEWRTQAHDRGLTFPPDSQLVMGGANEPNHGGKSYPVICDYARAYGWRAQHMGRIAALLILGSGHPAIDHPTNWNNWDAFAPLQPVIDAGGHWVETHGYHQKEGPFHVWVDEHGQERHDYPALAGRHHGCPLRAKHLIGECGVDGGIFDRDPRYGWQSYGISPDVFSQQMQQNHRALASNVVAMLPFSSDYQSDEWGGFDVRPVHSRMAAWALAYTGDDPLFPPDPEPEPEPEPVLVDGFERAMEFVFKWEGGLSTDPHDPGGTTKYGISQLSYPDLDIVNLTKAQALEIYRRDYWVASGAHEMTWPLSLVHFDAAVNTGVGQAEWFLDRSEFDWRQYIAERGTWYTKLRQWERYGKAWTRRTMDLLREAAI